jgi:hypothetical protein
MASRCELILTGSQDFADQQDSMRREGRKRATRFEIGSENTPHPVNPRNPVILSNLQSTSLCHRIGVPQTTEN